MFDVDETFIDPEERRATSAEFGKPWLDDTSGEELEE